MGHIQMRMAKASEKDIDTLTDFLHAAESLLERQKFSLHSPEDQWEDWDDDNADKILFLKIREEVADELGYRPTDVDNRIVAFEYLSKKFNMMNSWQRVVMASSALIESVCDPTERYLAFHPGFEFNHVANEQ